MRKLINLVSLLLIAGLLLGCSPSHPENVPATTAPQATVAPATTELTPVKPIQSVESRPSDTVRAANSIEIGKEILPVYDLENGVFSCPDNECTIGAFMYGGSKSFLVFQSTDAAQTHFTTFDVDEILAPGNIQIAGSDPAGDFVYSSYQNDWKNSLTDADPMLNGVSFDIRGEQLWIIDTKVSSADPVSATVWSPFYDDPQSTDQCLTREIRVEPGLQFGGDGCIFQDGKWVTDPQPYYTYDYGTPDLIPVAIKVPFTYNRTIRTWDPIKK